MKSLKLRFAEGLYRWNLSAGIVSVAFSALAFIGIFAVLFNAPWYVLLGVVVVVVSGTGFLLDHVVKIWDAQAKVGTVRNPYLKDLLYQKELLLLKYSSIPELRVLRFMLTYMQTPFESEPKFQEERQKFLESIDKAISKQVHTVGDKRWEIEPEEEVYG